MGNDFNYIEVVSNDVYENIKRLNYQHGQSENGKSLLIQDPDGYGFLVTPSGTETLTKATGVSLASSNLNETIKYWSSILKMNLVNQNTVANTVGLSYPENKFVLEFKKVDQVNHEEAFGRIAFSCVTSELEIIQKTIDENKYKVLTRLVSLDTPGKATVHVVILVRSRWS